MKVPRSPSAPFARGILLALPLLAALGCGRTLPFETSPLELLRSSLTVDRTDDLRADGVDEVVISVRLIDTSNRPLPHRAVQLAVSGDRNRLGPEALITDEDGYATARLSSTLAETKTLVATVNANGGPHILRERPEVTFRATEVDPRSSSVVATPSVLTADAREQSTITITLRDAQGNPIAGRAMDFSVSGTGNTLGFPKPTDDQGNTLATLSSSVAETKLLYVGVPTLDGGKLLLDPTTVTFRAGPPDATRTTVTVSPEQLPADGLSRTRVTVTARDAKGNPIRNAQVRLTATGADPLFVQPPATAATGVTVGTLASTRSGTKRLTAVVTPPGGAAITAAQHPAVLFLPTAPSLTVSTLVAKPNVLIADGSQRATLTVAVRDANGNGVPGVAITLSATGSDHVLTQPPAPTDAQGLATGALTSTRAEPKTVTAFLSAAAGGGALAQQATVAFLPGPPNAFRSTIAASPTALIADGVSTSRITVTIRDAQGNPVPFQRVALTASGAGNRIEQPVALTDLAGVATGAVASTAVGLKQVRATVDTDHGQVLVFQQASVAFFTSGPSTGMSSVAVSPAVVIADGSARTTVTVTVRDAGGNPVAGKTVAIAATGSDNLLTQPLAVTDARGVATGTLASRRAENKQVSARFGTGTPDQLIAQQPTVTFVAGPPSPILSTVVAAPLTVAADGRSRSTVTVSLSDAQGNRVSGQSVSLSATGAGNLFVQPGATDRDGIATGTLASASPGARTVTATVNPGAGQLVLPQQPVVTFATGAVSAFLSTVTAAPLNVAADGLASTTVTVTVVDGEGHPLPGLRVELQATGGGNLLRQPSLTDAQGVAVGGLASTEAGAKTITAVVNPQSTPVPLDQRPIVLFGNFGLPDPDKSTVEIAPSAVTADGVAEATITVTVRDASSVPLPGQTVAVSPDLSATIRTISSVTDLGGHATFAISSTVQGTVKVFGRVVRTPSDVQITRPGTVRFDPVSPGRCTVTADPLSARADGVAAISLGVTVLDRNDQPLAGIPVAFIATGSGNLIGQPPATGKDGTTTGSIRSSVAETKTATALAQTANGEVRCDSPPLGFTGGTPVPEQSTVTAAPSSLPADGITGATVTVTVRDAAGNPVPGVAVLLESSGTKSILTQPPVTDAAGVAIGKLASGRAETKALTATLDPDGLIPVVLTQHPQVTFLAGTPIDTPGTGCIQASSIAVDPGTGRPAIAYFRDSDLVFTQCTSNCVLAPVWSTPEVVDSNVSQCIREDAQLSMLFLSPGVPAIAYRDIVPKGVLGVTAKYAVKVGGSWKLDTIESISGSGPTNIVGPISMALVGPDRTPVVAYHSHNFEVRGARLAACVSGCATGTGFLWNRQNVDAIGENVGHYITVREDPITQRPRIAYQDDIATTYARLKFATCSDASPILRCDRGQGNWSVGSPEDVFGVRSGEWSSLDFRPDGTPVIVFQDETNTKVRMVTCTAKCDDGAAATWSRTTVDPGPFVGAYAWLRVDEEGQAHIAYFDALFNRLRYAVQSGTSEIFAISTVDSEVNGGQVSFLLGPPGTNFAYSMGNRLRYFPSPL